MSKVPKKAISEESTADDSSLDEFSDTLVCEDFFAWNKLVLGMKNKKRKRLVRNVVGKVHIYPFEMKEENLCLKSSIKTVLKNIMEIKELVKH